MVALQILVLSVEVRIPLSQPKQIPRNPDPSLLASGFLGICFEAPLRRGAWGCDERSAANPRWDGGGVCFAGEALGDVVRQARQIPVEIVHAIRAHKDLEEAAGAYKDIDEVMANQSDLVNTVTALSPVAVIKG